MKLSRILKRAVDACFGAVGLQVVKQSLDFDARPTGYALDQMIRSLADEFDGWCKSTQTWQVSPIPESRRVIERFYEQYLASPFRTQGGGSRFNNLLWLHLLAKASTPSLIIDSGTFRGASAWAFATALPDCPVVSFDISLSHLVHRSHGVTYAERDWVGYDFGNHDVGAALCYFDDHVDQGARLVQAVDRGIRRLIFDDDFPVTSFATMAHDGRALPKIAFLLDDGLTDIPELTWLAEGRPRRWPVNAAEIIAMRSRIAATEQLPNTSLITGIHQTPYRIVRGSTSATHVRQESQLAEAALLPRTARHD
jgi:hypothetical protein